MKYIIAVLPARNLLAGSLVALLLLAAPPRTHAQDATINPAAMEKFNLGLAAAQQQQWQVAVRYFIEAQEQDPAYAQTLFNLGLATSKMPGWELRSMAWFKAYLRAAPQASNAKAVEDLIATLRVRFEGNIGRFTKEMLPIARLVAKKGEEWRKEDARYGDLMEIPYVTFLMLGDEASAKTVQPRGPTGYLPMPLPESIISHRPELIPYASALAYAGKFDQAWSNSLRQPQSALFFVKYLLREGRLEEARKLVLPLLERPKNHNWEELKMLACRAQELNQAVLVSEIVAKLKKTATQDSPDSYWYAGAPSAYFELVLWRSNAGEIDEAHEILAKAIRRGKQDDMIKDAEKRRQSDVGRLPHVCRGAWWLSAEFQAYLFRIGREGNKFTLYDATSGYATMGEYDETRLLEAIEFAKASKRDELVNMFRIFVNLMGSAYTYRNIFH